MPRFVTKAFWMILIICFGMIFGLDQAAKYRGENPGEIHRSSLPRLEENKQKVVEVNSGVQVNASNARLIREEAVVQRNNVASAAGINQIKEIHSDSTMNRLGNNLGDSFRGVASRLVDWVAGLFGGLFH